MARKAYPKYVELTKQLAQQMTDVIVIYHEEKSVGSKPKSTVNAADTGFSTDAGLTSAQVRIKNFLECRRIKYLLHFTDKRNIASIKKYGLLSVSLLTQKRIAFVANDDARYDGHEDGISLSISEENLYVKRSFVNRYPDREYKTICIDASILYREPTRRIYCQTNAATISGQKGSAFEDLEATFAPKVCYTLHDQSEEYCFTRFGKADNQPTTPQAEILWLGTIPPEYLRFED